MIARPYIVERYADKERFFVLGHLFFQNLSFSGAAEFAEFVEFFEIAACNNGNLSNIEASSLRTQFKFLELV